MKALSLLLLLALASCKTAPPKPEPPPDARTYYPLAVGNTWTYEISGSPDRATIQIIGRDGEWFLDDHRGRLRYQENGVRDADRFLLRAPLVAGTRWTAVENLVVEHFEITGADAAVVTQAGTFVHCVVVRTSSLVKKGVNFVTEWTYAPHVGIAQVVTSTVDEQGKIAEQSRLSLVAMHLEQ